MTPIIRQILSSKKILARDRFDRPDTTDGMGQDDTGKTWTASSGTWGIIGNSAYKSAGSAGIDTSVVNVGRNDFFATCRYTVSYSNKLIFRYIDANNFNFITTDGTYYAVYRRVAAINTMEFFYSVTCAVGDVLGIKVKGTKTALYLNGQVVKQGVVTANLLGTSVGIGSTASGAVLSARWDDFKVVAV